MIQFSVATRYTKRLTKCSDYARAQVNADRAMEALNVLRKAARVDQGALIQLSYFAQRAMATAFEATERYHDRLAGLDREMDSTACKDHSKVNMLSSAWQHIFDAICQGVLRINDRALPPDEGDTKDLRLKEVAKHRKLFAIKVFERFAKHKLYWPSLRSLQDTFNRTFQLQTNEILNELTPGLGLGLHVVDAKWNFKDVAGQIALNSWQQIANARNKAPRDDQDLDPEEIPEERFREKARALKDFMKDDAWQDWKKLASELLDEELKDSIFSALLDRIKVPKGRPKKSYRRQQVLDRFRSMAGSTK